MKLEYKFVNGEKTIIEVGDEFEKAILELDRNLYNNNRKETSCHISLNALDKVEKFSKANVLGLEDQMLNRTDKEILYEAISELKPDEQELIHSLYLSDHPTTPKEYAKIKSLNIGSVKMRLQRTRAKLKWYIKKKQ